MSRKHSIQARIRAFHDKIFAAFEKAVRKQP